MCKFMACRNLSSSPEVALCGQHRCHYRHVNENYCISSVVGEGFTFCIEHKCSVDECGRRIVSKGERYCKEHACKRCIEIGKIPSALAIDDPPCNTCVDHPMCLMPNCFVYCEVGVKYCEDHFEIKCCAKTIRGNPSANSEHAERVFVKAFPSISTLSSILVHCLIQTASSYTLLSVCRMEVCCMPWGGLSVRRRNLLITTRSVM